MQMNKSEYGDVVVAKHGNEATLYHTTGDKAGYFVRFTDPTEGSIQLHAHTLVEALVEFAETMYVLSASNGPNIQDTYNSVYEVTANKANNLKSFLDVGSDGDDDFLDSMFEEFNPGGKAN